MHIHVHCADGGAKFWIEPRIEPAQNTSMSQQQLKAVQAMIEAHIYEIRRGWQRHFGS